MNVLFNLINIHEYLPFICRFEQKITFYNFKYKNKLKIFTNKIHKKIIFLKDKGEVGGLLSISMPLPTLPPLNSMDGLLLIGEDSCLILVLDRGLDSRLAAFNPGLGCLFWWIV